MHSIMRSTMVLAAVSLAFLAGPPPAASGPYHQLSPQEVTSQLQAAGYTHVHDIEIDEGLYEAEAVSTAGVPVDLQIDPASGRIVTEERDD